MKLFPKLRDYNNELEEILEKKTFSSNAKNLLLSMIYKLEICYRDYDQVKVYSLNKNEFFSNILNVIKNYCDNVKIVEPNSVDAELLKKNDVEALTNSNERSMLIYPTEQSILYALCDIEPKYFYIKENFIFKNVFQRILVDGYKQNTMEIFENFNGWSWDINRDITKSACVSNLIYQNILFIVGEDSLNNWRVDNTGKKDYLAELKKTIKKVTGNDNYYFSLCKLLYLVAKTKNKAQIKHDIESAISSTKSSTKIKGFYDVLNNNNSYFEELIQLQKYFLIFLKKKIEKIDNSDEMIEMLYFLRYYQNINISQGILLKEYNKFSSDLNFLWKLAITKSCKLNIIKIISMDIETNFEFMKYIFDTKIIKLEDIRFLLNYVDEEVEVIMFDKDTFEKKNKFELKINRKDIVVRKNRKIKLFN